MHVVVHTSMALFLLLVVHAGGGLDDNGGGSNLAMSCVRADGLNHAFDAILRGKKNNDQAWLAPSPATHVFIIYANLTW